ncbi:MAG: UPF0149 family protein [Steroidobacteraceae bacterium]
MQPVSHADLEASLMAAGSAVSASEAHGCVCGTLCADLGFSTSELAVDLLPEESTEETASALVATVTSLREGSLDGLAGGEMGFQPLLPDDEQPLADRVEALAAWCGGFLYGLGRAGADMDLPGDLGEILGDFSEISRASLQAHEGDEEGEASYLELTEFVRASVQLAFEELAPWRDRTADQSRTRH